MSPFFTFGIYLDNWSSGFLVQGNIIRGATLSPIFVHGGANNTIKNNVMYNSTTSHGVKALGQYGYCPSFAQGMSLGTMSNNGAGAGFDFPENITFANNLVLSNVDVLANVRLISADHLSQMGVANFSNFSKGLVVDSNVYYNAKVPLGGSGVLYAPFFFLFCPH